MCITRRKNIKLNMNICSEFRVNISLASKITRLLHAHHLWFLAMFMCLY
jgi:hypothetical protein